MNGVLRVLSGLIGAALIVFGVYAMLATASLAAMTGLSAIGVAGLNETRAIYAGSFWAMGALVLYGLADRRFTQPLLIAVGVIFAGFVAGRVVSIAIGGYDPKLAAAIGSEIVIAIILIATGRTRTA